MLKNYHLIMEEITSHLPGFSNITITAVAPEGQPHHRELIQCINCETGSLVKFIEKYGQDPHTWYSWLNTLPNVKGGKGFSDLVSGFEPYLENQYSEEMIRKFPVLAILPA